MKKKLMAILMSAVMVLGVFGTVALAEDSAEAETETAADEASEVAEAAIELADLSDSDCFIGVFYYTYSDTYISSVRTALDACWAEMGLEEGSGYQNYDGNSNQTTQNEQIDTAISMGATCLIVNIVTSGSVDASQAIVDKASAAGIPVIFFNRAVESDEEEGTVLGSYDACAFVGTDAPEAGHMQGQLIGDYVVENYDAIDLNGDGVISYAMFMGQLGNAEAIYRTQYAVEDANAILTEAGYPELVYFDESNTDCYQVDQDGSWSAAAANNYMVTNLSQYNEDNGNMIELVICNNDSMAEGVISALNDAGYNLGAEDSTLIPVFGVDATDAAKQLIADGKMIGTIKQDADGMAECIAYLAGSAALGNDLTEGTEDLFTISDTLSNKIYIPYATYTGEE